MWWEARFENTVLFISNYFVFFCLLPIYCSVIVLLFWKSSKVESWSEVISTRAELIHAVELLLCETALYLSSGDVFVLNRRDVNFELCASCRTYNATFVIIVFIELWYSKMFSQRYKAHSWMYNLSSMLWQDNLSSPVLLLSNISWKSESNMSVSVAPIASFIWMVWRRCSGH